MTSTIKVDNIQKTSDGSNIIKKCGSTITIGSSGQTVAVACGATTSGMGRTGTVDWCTTAKTSPFTATNGSGFFVNTSSGAVTVTLPSSPTAGQIVAFSDYASTWNTNNLTVCRNSSLINGVSNNAILRTRGSAVTLVYVDGTRGWKQVNDATENVSGASDFICATGGTITTCGDYKIHTFNASGCFAVTAGASAPNNVVSYVVVGGGGGGGYSQGGGGGAGGFREGKNSPDPYADSPLDAGSGIVISTQTYSITVGAGGAGGPPSASGTNSIFSTITSAGGGKGSQSGGSVPGGSGGSGGGGGEQNPGGTGNSPPVSPAQGTDGGSGVGSSGGGGGGGASAAGTNGSPGNAGPGGAGVSSSITGASVARAGGGGGGTNGSNGGSGGSGGGGAGKGTSNPTPQRNGENGTANTGGGGGAAGTPNPASLGGGQGGSGVVIIRYKFQ